MRDPERVPISDVTEDELADMHVKYACPGEKPYNADVSDEALTEVLETARENLEKGILIGTIESLTMSAKFIRQECLERDQIPSDKTIGFVSEGGLEQDPRAAMIAVEAYNLFLLSKENTGEILENTLSFFSILERTFAAMGVQT